MFFWNAGEEITGNFDGYKFEFRNSGKIMASDGVSSDVGIWETSMNGDKIRLFIKFYNEGATQDLTREWTFALSPLENNVKFTLEHLVNTKQDS